MKKSLKLSLSLLPLFAGTVTSLSSCVITSESYITKNVIVYEGSGQGGQTSSFVSLRFFGSTPNVPYIGVSQFFRHFFKTDVYMERKGPNYIYRHDENNPEYISFAPGSENFNTFGTNGIESFNSHPDVVSATSKTFICENEQDEKDTIVTPAQDKLIPLDNYSIRIYGDSDDAYVPLAFLNDMFGSSIGYSIAYNGKDVYIYDLHANLHDQPQGFDYYGDKYYEVLGDLSVERPDDLAKYVYNQLCFTFDNLRGFTSQLVFGDNNLLALGLNGLLESKPKDKETNKIWNTKKIKEYLLSKDKSKYFQGMVALFSGLSDGGHTGLSYPKVDIVKLLDYPFRFNVRKAMMEAIEDDDFQPLIEKSEVKSLVDGELRKAVINQKKESLNLTAGDISNANFGFYYKPFPAKKIAYIGFDGFNMEFAQWDDFYKSGATVLPEKLITSDSFAFIRDKFVQAKKAGIDKVVLDLSSNYGGTVGALIGIGGLLNKGKCNYNTNDTLNKTHSSAIISNDLNLDGVFNDKDVQWAHDNLDGLKIGVLTTSCAFSCGNLLPCILKDYGYKIIGAKTGGGSCSVMYSTTADGLCYQHSSNSCLTDQAGNNIDGGVEPDYLIKIGVNADEEKQVIEFDTSGLFDIDTIASYLDTAYSK